MAAGQVVSCVKCGRELPEGAVFCPYCGRKQTRDARKRVHGNGQGCVYKLPNGKWRAEKTLGYTVEELPDGSVRKRREAVTKSGFRTKNEAIAALPTLTAKEKAARKLRRTGETETARKGESITLKALYDQWEPTHDRGKSTINCYRSGFKLFAPLWSVPMSDIDIDDLQDCLDESDKGKRTKENARAALGLIYKYGIPRNCIPKDRNLAPFLKISGESGSQKQGFTTDQLEKIRKAAEAGNETAAVVLCHCYLGFRPTALLQLRLEDYNETERAFVGGIKTEAGIGRTVTVSPKIQPYIDKLRAGRTSGPLIIEDGKAVSLERYRARFYDLLMSLEIDNPIDTDGRHAITPHSCRHTFATLMKRVQAPDKDKLELIGHTSTEQLRDYQDVSFADLRAITDLI